MQKEVTVNFWYLAMLVRKYALFTIVFCTVICVGAYMAAARQPSVYSTTILVKTPYKLLAGVMDNSDVVFAFDNQVIARMDAMSKKIEAGDTTTLSQELGISKEEADKLLPFAVTMKQNPLGFVEAKINASSQGGLVGMQEYIVKYLNKDPYMETHIKKMRLDTKNGLEALDRQIQNSIKLKESIEKKIAGGTTLAFNPLEMEKSIIDMTDKKRFYTAALAELDGCKIANSPAIPSSPSKPKPKFAAAIAFGAALFLSILIIFVYEAAFGKKNDD